VIDHREAAEAGLLGALGQFADAEGCGLGADEGWLVSDLNRGSLLTSGAMKWAA
jgi:hypothetical protein